MSESRREQFIREVAGEEEEKKPETGEEEISPELKAFLDELVSDTEKFLDAHKALFTTFAKDVSLTFKPAFEGFKINLKEGKVFIDMRWFRERGYSQDQIVWACFHELAHFADLKSDPEGTLKNFNYVDGKGAEARTYHTFYNVFDDIFVNRLVARRAPAYSPDAVGGKETKRLYREKLFPKEDYGEIPRHLQFLYGLLRPIMVPEEEMTVSDEVKEVLEKPVKVLGRQMTLQKFLDTFIKPTGGAVNAEENLPRRRYELLRQYVEPIFNKLLREDQLDPRFQKEEPGEGEGEGEPGGGMPGEPGGGTPGEGKPGKGEPGGEGKPGKGGAGGGKPGKGQFGKYYDQYDANNPDQIDPKDIKNWIEGEKKKDDDKKKKEEEAKKEAKKSPAKKAAEAMQKADKAFAERNGIPEQVDAAV